MAIVLPTAIFATLALTQCPTHSVNFLRGLDCGTFGGHPPTSGWGLESHGDACGFYVKCDGTDQPSVWPSGGGLVPITFPFAITYGRSMCVNDGGAVVGEIDSPTFIGRRAFRWSNSAGSILETLPGHNWTEAHGLNTAGIAVGFSSYNTTQAVYWPSDSNIPTTLTLPVGPHANAWDINDSNQICGWMGIYPLPDEGSTPFIWSAGVTTSLQLPPYAIGDTGAANALNNRGDACGYFFMATAPVLLRRACAWIDGQFIDLGVLPGCNRSFALDINDAREVVGYCAAAQGGQIIAFVWRDGVMRSLGSLTGQPDYVFKLGRAINNRGQIAGEGYGPLSTAAFIVTPSPPATPGDTNCDSLINVTDLLTVITNWNPPGPVGGNPADLNRDNCIDVNDLLQVIQHWN